MTGHGTPRGDNTDYVHTNAPTLEIFQYDQPGERPEVATNTPGFTHIAFSVPDVAAALDAVVAAGGAALGEIVTLNAAGAGRVTLVYAQDPEGNIVELQRWHT